MAEVQLKYLVVGTGRCGTVYLARLLTSVGIPCGHERIFNGGSLEQSMRTMYQSTGNSACSTACGHDLTQYRDEEIMADSSYLAVPFLDDSRLRNCRIVHAVRNPLRVVLSFLNDIKFFRHRRHQDVTHDHERFIYEHLPSLEEFDDPVSRACHYYVEWNGMVERRTQGRRRFLHPVENDPAELFDFLGVGAAEDYFRETICNSYRRWPQYLRTYESAELYTPDDVLDCNLRDELLRIAAQYGYRNLKQDPILDEYRRLLELARSSPESSPAGTASRRAKEPRPVGEPASKADPAGVPQLLEEGFCGFNIALFEGMHYGLAQEAGHIDLHEMTDEQLRALKDQSRCFVGRSVDDVKRRIAAYRSGLREIVGPDACFGTKLDVHSNESDLTEEDAAVREPPRAA